MLYLSSKGFKGTEQGRYMNDVEVLAVNQMIHESRVNKGTDYASACARRIELLTEIAIKSEDGKVAVVFSGRDCDCVEYSNEVSIIDANGNALNTLLDEEYKNAEGPINWYIQYPSVAAQLKYSSYDRIMAAYENGNMFGLSV
jgi:hypothetical protein